MMIRVHMITKGEINFIKEVLYELTTLADPSEYIEGEVKEAMDLLEKLSSYNLEHVMEIYSIMNKQIEQMNEDYN